MNVQTLGCLRVMHLPVVSYLISTLTSLIKKMYEELDTFERALQHFGTRVEVIAAMEMGGRISAEDAYQMIKTEVKELKKVRKQEKK